MTTRSVPSSKRDFPPLLGAGLHPKTTAELKSLCVDGFPRSVGRGKLFERLETLMAGLTAVGVQGEVWIDGSFLTRKTEPRDIDLVLKVDATFYDSATAAQRAVIDAVGNALKGAGLDAYRFFHWPPWHALASFGEEQEQYWLKQFGYGRDGGAKGIAVLKFGGIARE